MNTIYYFAIINKKLNSDPISMQIKAWISNQTNVAF